MKQVAAEARFGLDTPFHSACLLLTGNVAEFERKKHLFDSWFHFAIAKAAYAQPLIGVSDLSKLAEQVKDDIPREEIRYSKTWSVELLSEQFSSFADYKLEQFHHFGPVESAGTGLIQSGSAELHEETGRSRRFLVDWSPPFRPTRQQR